MLTHAQQKNGIKRKEKGKAEREKFWTENHNGISPFSLAQLIKQKPSRIKRGSLVTWTHLSGK